MRLCPNISSSISVFLLGRELLIYRIIRLSTVIGWCCVHSAKFSRTFFWIHGTTAKLPRSILALLLTAFQGLAEAFNEIFCNNTNFCFSEDMKIIVEFMYTGRVNAVRKRYLSLREASMTLGVYRLPEILTNELVNGGQLQSSHSAFFGGSHLPSPQILPPSTSATDVSERCFGN